MMVSINEELEAAKAAINSLWTTKSAALETLKKANHAAILNLSSGGPSNQRVLNEARGKVGIAVANLLHGLPTQEKIDKAKRTIEAWIRELEASPAA
jgi:hypothetical protein